MIILCKSLLEVSFSRLLQYFAGCFCNKNGFSRKIAPFVAAGKVLIKFVFHENRFRFQWCKRSLVVTNARLQAQETKERSITKR